MVELEELRGEALHEATAIAESWARPTCKWPQGTTVREVPTSHFDQYDHDREYSNPSRYHLVTFPSGGELITLTSRKDADEVWAYAKAPHVTYYFGIEGREVVATPHVCQMSARSSRRPEDYDKTSWIAGEIGLQARYIVGQLSKPVREYTRVEPDGYGF